MRIFLLALVSGVMLWGQAPSVEPQLAAMRGRYPSFVLVPRAPPGSTWGPPPEIARKQGLYMKNLLPLIFEVIAELERSYPIDAKRIYALGASMGGRGTWNILAARPDLFAAGIPVCGKTRLEEAERLADMPIWCFHGDADPRVAVRYSREIFARMREIGGQMKYTELRGVKHNSWLQAFRYTGDDKAAGYITRYASERADRTPDVWEWLFRQTKP